MTIPYITPKQQEIPKLIYKHRFLNRLQIQKLLNHKDKGLINRWLKDLVKKEYLEKVPKVNNFEQRTKLTIYYIGINGIRFLKIQDNCSDEIIKKLYKDKNRSDDFISQCILLADVYIDLKNKTTDRDGVSYEVIMNSDFINVDPSWHFLTDLNPNLVYKETKKMKDRSRSTYNLLTIFEPTLPRYSVRKILRNYFQFYFNNQWEDNVSQSFPTIKFILSTKAELIYAKRYTKKLLEENQNPDDFYILFSTVDEVKKTGVVTTIWEEI